MLRRCGRGLGCADVVSGRHRSMLWRWRWIVSRVGIVESADVPCSGEANMSGAMVAQSSIVEGNKPNLLGPVMDVFRQMGRIIASSREHLVAGAAARAVSIFAMYPIDTLKTRLQVLFKSNPYFGLLPSLLGQTPYGMLVFGSYETYKQLLRDSAPDLGERARILLSACLGDLTGSLWLCPSEVIKQQLQNGLHTNVISAVQVTLKQAGIGGLYQGYSGLIVRDVPFRVSQLFFYEELKRAFRERSKRESRPIENLLLGATAGSLAAALTTPLDVVKTRLMTQTLGPDGVAYKGAIGCVLNIARNEGVVGLFRGIGPRVLLIAPSNAVFFLVYEAVIKRMASRARTSSVLGQPSTKSVAVDLGTSSSRKGARFASIRCPRLQNSTAMC